MRLERGISVYEDLMAAADAAKDTSRSFMEDARNAAHPWREYLVDDARYWNGLAVRLRRMAQTTVDASSVETAVNAAFDRAARRRDLIKLPTRREVLDSIKKETR